MRLCTSKKVHRPTSCATTAFDVFVLKDVLVSGTSAFTKSDVDVISYRVTDDIDAASSVKASYVVATYNPAEGEVPQQQCVVESNGGESVGETTVGAAKAVQVDLDITGGDMTLGISGIG